MSTSSRPQLLVVWTGACDETSSGNILAMTLRAPYLADLRHLAQYCDRERERPAGAALGCPGPRRRTRYGRCVIDGELG
jgi:hypothetical protein